MPVPRWWRHCFLHCSILLVIDAILFGWAWIPAILGVSSKYEETGLVVGVLSGTIGLILFPAFLGLGLLYIVKVRKGTWKAE